MRRLRNLYLVLLTLMVLLSTQGMLLANTEEVWVNERNNIEMTQSFFLDMVNKLKYESEMYKRFEEALYSERKAFAEERQAFQEERAQWKQLEKELNEYAQSLFKENKKLKATNDLYKSVLLIAVGGLIYEAVN